MTFCGRGADPSRDRPEADSSADQEERKQVVKQKELWIDIGGKGQGGSGSRRAIGDAVTLELGYQEMRNNLANSPAWTTRPACGSASKRCAACKARRLKVALYAVSTVQEEIGLRGATDERLRRQPAGRHRG